MIEPSLNLRDVPDFGGSIMFAQRRAPLPDRSDIGSLSVCGSDREGVAAIGISIARGISIQARRRLLTAATAFGRN